MLVIRLQPNGRTGRISYRIVVSEKRSKLVGTSVDDLGFYNPTVKPEVISLDMKKLSYWQSKGALVSAAVKKLAKTK